MRAWGIATGLTCVLVMTACGDDGGSSQPIDAPDVVIDAAPNADAFTGPARTLFLNRNGGTYAMGANDAVANTQGFANMTVTAPPYPFGDPEWTATKDCVTALFAPFRVNVVDVDPGTTDHVEILITTNPQVFGFSSGVGGVAPAVANCPVLERGFAPVFATPYGAAATQEVCWLAGSMAGIIYGLDWALHCPDVMTYLGGCGAKAFRDVAANCGEQSARACRCGGTTQNSYRHLLGALGAR